MGNWSISPNELASIDSTGKVTYSSHEIDTQYVITYSDDECGTVTKNITIKACCNCSSLTVTGKTDISSVGGNNIAIGSFSKSSCMSNVRATSSESWITNLSISGSEIKANIGADESSGRTGVVTIKADKDGGETCSKDMTVKQVAGGSCRYPSSTIQFMVQIKVNKDLDYSAYILTDEVIGSNCIDTVMNLGQTIFYDSTIKEPGYGNFGYCRYDGCVSADIQGKYLHILAPGSTGCDSAAEIRYNITYGDKLYISGLFKNSTDNWQAANLGAILIPTADEIQEQAQEVNNMIVIIFTDSSRP